MNDILSNSGTIDANYILSKLKNKNNKNNWIAEVNTLKKAIPTSWKTTLTLNVSTKTKVNTRLLLDVKNKPFKQMSNKDVYQTYIRQFYEKPYMHSYWNQRLKENICWNSWYYIVHKSISDNKVRQFKIKLLHNLVATNLNLFTWKLNDSPLCNNCQALEDNEHFLIQCPVLTNFWIAIDSIFKKCGLQKTFKNIKYIVTGYKSPKKITTLLTLY